MDARVFLRQKRIQKKISIDQMALKLGVTTKFVQAYEAHKTKLSISYINKACKILGVKRSIQTILE